LPIIRGKIVFHKICKEEKMSYGQYKTASEMWRGVSVGWTAQNPILPAGEFGVEIDTNKFKVGDGVSRWNSLPYGFGTAAVATAPAVTSVAGRTGDVTLSTSDIAGLAPVAITGTYASLAGVPFIPTAVSQLANDAGYLTSVPAVVFPFDLSMSFVGGAFEQGQIVGQYVLGAYNFPVGLVGSMGYAGITAAANTSLFLTVERAGTTVASGKIDFAAGATSCTFEFLSAFTSQPGDVLVVQASTDAADPTFANVSVTLALTRA
jgi:hypothetical protein